MRFDKLKCSCEDCQQLKDNKDALVLSLHKNSLNFQQNKNTEAEYESEWSSLL